jgi:hypothetical protein
MVQIHGNTTTFCSFLCSLTGSSEFEKAEQGCFGNQRRRSIISATGSVVKQYPVQICGYSPIYSLTTHYFLLLKLIHLGSK